MATWPFSVLRVQRFRRRSVETVREGSQRLNEQGGESVEYDRFTTPLGSMIGAVDAKGRVVRLEFADSRQLPAPFRSSSWSRRKGCCEPLRKQLEQYFAGRRKAFDLPQP